MTPREESISYMVLLFTLLGGLLLGISIVKMLREGLREKHISLIHKINLSAIGLLLPILTYNYFYGRWGTGWYINFFIINVGVFVSMLYLFLYLELLLERKRNQKKKKQ